MRSPTVTIYIRPVYRNLKPTPHMGLNAKGLVCHAGGTNLIICGIPAEGLEVGYGEWFQATDQHMLDKWAKAAAEGRAQIAEVDGDLMD